MTRQPVLKITAKFLIPLIMLFALYVQFHGEYSPGGGFQAGVIFAAAIILYGLVFGIEEARQVLPLGFLKAMAAGGALLFGAVGVASLALGGEFLNYNVFLADPVSAQHLGILLVELGVGLTVTAVMVIIFFCFAGREHV
jgi:multicomponent Na+:H+ antiporter subunit B